MLRFFLSQYQDGDPSRRFILFSLLNNKLIKENEGSLVGIDLKTSYSLNNFDKLIDYFTCLLIRIFSIYQ